MAKKSRMFGIEVKLLPRTKKHRPAVWECMLGTVYAMNDAGEIRYFDYKQEEALKFAGVTEDRDPRWYKLRKYKDQYQWSDGRLSHAEPRVDRKVLWITEA